MKQDADGRAPAARGEPALSRAACRSRSPPGSTCRRSRSPTPSARRARPTWRSAPLAMVRTLDRDLLRAGEFDAVAPSVRGHAVVPILDRGSDLHVHSTFSDGASTVEENVASAAGHGLHTIGLVDHVRRSTDWVPVVRRRGAGARRHGRPAHPVRRGGQDPRHRRHDRHAGRHADARLRARRRPPAARDPRGRCTLGRRRGCWPQPSSTPDQVIEDLVEATVELARLLRPGDPRPRVQHPAQVRSPRGRGARRARAPPRPGRRGRQAWSSRSTRSGRARRAGSSAASPTTASRLTMSTDAHHERASAATTTSRARSPSVVATAPRPARLGAERPWIRTASASGCSSPSSSSARCRSLVGAFQYLLVGLHRWRNHYDELRRLPATRWRAGPGVERGRGARHHDRPADALDYPRDRLRVYVVDDASTDDTPARAGRQGRRSTRDRSSTCAASRAGRARRTRSTTGSAGAGRRLDARRVLIMDADVVFEPESLRQHDPPPRRPGGRRGHRLHQGGQRRPGYAQPVRSATSTSSPRPPPAGPRTCSACWPASPAAPSCTRRANLEAHRRRASTPRRWPRTPSRRSRPSCTGRTVVFEPNAIVWAEEPDDIDGLWKQRLRWARGNVQVTPALHGRVVPPSAAHGLGGLSFGMFWFSTSLLPVFMILSSSALVALWFVDRELSRSAFRWSWIINALCYVFITAYALLLDRETGRRCWRPGGDVPRRGLGGRHRVELLPRPLPLGWRRRHRRHRVVDLRRQHGRAHARRLRLGGGLHARRVGGQGARQPTASGASAASASTCRASGRCSAPSPSRPT